MIPFWLALAALLSSWATVVHFNAVDMVTAISVSPVILWNTGVFLAISALVWSSDWRLGLFLAYVTLNALRTPFMARPWSGAAAIVLGGFAFTLLREKPPHWVKDLLVWSGVLQVALAVAQVLGWDPIWHQQPSSLMNLGTIGHQTLFGAFCAVVGVIASGPLQLIFFAGAWLSGSRLAVAAMTVVWIMKTWRESRRLATGFALACLAAFVLNHRFIWDGGKSLDSYHGRLVAWRVGVEVWWEHFILFGSGTNGWGWYMPQWADRFKELGASEAFLNAHSLPVTILLEHGLVGLGLAGLFVWGHRRAILGSPPAVALLILSLASFPLYLAQVAAPALVAVALTWRRDEDKNAGLASGVGRARGRRDGRDGVVGNRHDDPLARRI